MEFEHYSQATCYKRVAGLLRDLFRDRLWASPERPYFVVRQGSAAQP
jgi:hypothetical protein